MLLRKDDPWDDSLPVPDVRNWRVVDADGRPVGFVQSVFIDRAEKRFEALYTGANERFSASDIEVGEGLVKLRRSLGRPREERPEHHVARAGTFEASFRAHFEETYRDLDADYEELKAAYRFGRVTAADGDFSGRAYNAAQEDLKARYETGQHAVPFDVAEPAIRFAYDLVGTTGRYRKSGLEREGKQILAPDEKDARASARAGTFMSTGRPAIDDAKDSPDSG